MPPLQFPPLVQTKTLSLSFLYPALAPARHSTFVLLSRTQQRKPSHLRTLHLTPRFLATRAPKSRDRGPPSSEDTQTDFSALNVLGNATPPATGVDACTQDGFVLNNDIRVTGCGVLLVGGEAFRWRPWVSPGRREGTIGEGGTGEDGLKGSLKDSRGLWEAQNEAWGVLDLVWPKPGEFIQCFIRLPEPGADTAKDLLILGTGPSIRPPSPKTRQRIHDLGIRLEVQDTRNAAAQFNLLATERGLSQVAAALVPVGWRG